MHTHTHTYTRTHTHTHTHIHHQNDYYECVQAMLIHYPKEMNHVVQMVFNEQIPESKILSLLEYLCNTSAELLIMSVSQLASRTCSAGMELLR